MNLKNIVFLITLNLINLNLIGCDDPMNKFDWKARESAPVSFPMRIVEGNFSDKEGGSLYVPDKRTIHQGWGYGVSSHVVGADKKNLPNRLEITCFSFSEDEFYSGKYELPYEHILSMFRAGYYSPKMGENITFDSLVVGVAPGGYLTVWATGIDKRVEIFTGKMEKADVPWERVLSNPKVSRNDFIHSVLEESLNDQEYSQIKQNNIPIGLWEKYATRYKWLPIVSGTEVPNIIKDINFVNGERDYYSPELGSDWEDQSRAVPTEMTLSWLDSEGSERQTELVFDVKSIVSAFDEMSEKSKAFNLNIDIKNKENGLVYNIALVSGENRVLINNTKVKYF